MPYALCLMSYASRIAVDQQQNSCRVEVNACNRAATAATELQQLQQRIAVDQQQNSCRIQVQDNRGACSCCSSIAAVATLLQMFYAAAVLLLVTFLRIIAGHPNLKRASKILMPYALCLAPRNFICLMPYVCYRIARHSNLSAPRLLFKNFPLQICQICQICQM